MDQEKLLFRKEPNIYEINIPFTVGGGIKTEEDVHTLLQNGADKISINTLGRYRIILFFCLDLVTKFTHLSKLLIKNVEPSKNVLMLNFKLQKQQKQP